MACFRSISAFQLASGSVVFDWSRSVERYIQVPCGCCIGCRLDRSRQWAVRCVHEASLFEHSSFVTLTYSAENLISYSLQYRDFQLFMKRLRKSCGPTRFYMCGEYGEDNGRPHFHSLLFGCRFADQVAIKQLSCGDILYRSPQLERLWPFGFSSIGAVTFDSAAYVARYAQKSLVGGHGKRQAVDKYFVEQETGECFPFVPEFVRMSNGGGKSGAGGIGAQWFAKYHEDVFGKQAEPALDRVVTAAGEMKPPKYYDTLLGRADEYRLQYVKFVRGLEASRRGDTDVTPARLLVREAVAKARLSLKSRGL